MPRQPTSPPRPTALQRSALQRLLLAGALGVLLWLVLLASMSRN